MCWFPTFVDLAEVARVQTVTQDEKVVRVKNF